MREPVWLTNYVVLGEYLLTLNNPRVAISQIYAREVDKFIRQLEICGLRRTLSSARSLEGLSIPSDARAGHITSIAAGQLEHQMKPITETLYSELNDQRAICVLGESVSTKLQALADKLNLNNTQTYLLEETVRCLEVGAYRAAAIIAWNLVYDCIRQWIYENHLETFNNRLATDYRRRGEPIYSPIRDYDDFWEARRPPGERTVIDASHSAGIIRGKLYDQLCHYLRERNQMAHPNQAMPSPDQSNAYIDNLIDIITGKPFTN